jgi:hypothetical protein
MMLAGPGCSGTIQNNLPIMNYHASRRFAAAIGAKTGQSRPYSDSGGRDGDGYAMSGPPGTYI